MAPVETDVKDVIEMAEEHDDTSTLTVFVDESGNTGDAASDVMGFGGQRVFTLVGLGDDSGSVATVFAKMLAKHNVRADEMKGRSMKRRPAFARDLLAELKASSSIFVELMDKKFYLAANLVTFALHGRAFHPLRQWELANHFADVMTEVVEDAAIVAYAEFGSIRDQQAFTAFEVAFRRALLRAKLGMGAHQEREFQLLEKIEASFIMALDERRADLLSFLPPPDTDSRGRLVAMLPHVSALANLLGRINLHASQYGGIRVVHDQQAQFEATLRDCRDGLDALSARMVAEMAGTPAGSRANWSLAGRVRLDFTDSKLSSGIQAADVLARFCTQRMTAILTGSPTQTHPNQDEAADLLRDLGSPRTGIGVNIVATTRDAERFWPQGPYARRRGV